MVDGGASEDASAAGEFEVADLEEDGKGFEDVDPADEEQEKFLSDDDGDEADEPAEWQRP